VKAGRLFFVFSAIRLPLSVRKARGTPRIVVLAGGSNDDSFKSSCQLERGSVLAGLSPSDELMSVYGRGDPLPPTFL
jgi:hypothetical protein